MSNEHRKYDVIGDLHGCYDELLALLEKLGYALVDDGLWRHSEGRKMAFVGDFTDRGPKNLNCLVFVAKHVKEDLAHAVQGNHDNKLARWLNGNNVKVGRGLEVTANEFQTVSTELGHSLRDFILDLPYWKLLDSDRLLICHAAPPFEANNFDEKVWLSNKARKSRCLYGKTTGRKTEDGYPERLDWALEYKFQEPYVVYGHIACGPLPYMTSNTCCVDSGAVFGDGMTALRWPEKEIVQVPTPQYSVR